MSFHTALISNIVKHRLHVWAGRLAPAGVVIALEASAAARAGALHDVVQRCWSQSLLYTVTGSTAASRINSVLCLYHILYVKFWYTLYVTIIMYWTITHSRKNGRFAFEFIALFIALHCHCVRLSGSNTQYNNHINQMNFTNPLSNLWLLKPNSDLWN